VAEAGAVEHVIQNPRHPYTQLLVQSIPQPDPRKRWGEIHARGDADQDGSSTGCKFADRCPYMMDICTQTVPPFYQTDPHRVVSCFLHREANMAASNDVATIFAPAAAARVTARG
jgi:peptide/nickel transport system ATP-binding protein